MEPITDRIWWHLFVVTVGCVLTYLAIEITQYLVIDPLTSARFFRSCVPHFGEQECARIALASGYL